MRIRARREEEREAEWDSDGTWPAEARAGAAAKLGEKGLAIAMLSRRGSEKQVLQKG